jgi:endonuclease/exonuclease/phosphatase family metal-dependent hydrolase
MRKLLALGFVALVAPACSDAGPLASADQAIVLSASASASVPSSVELNVVTRNLYLGGDIAPIIGAEDPVAAANEIWNEILHTNYPARAVHLAAEIARIEPDLVGLQEVIRFTVGPFGAPEFPSAPLLDFLDVLRANLATHGLEYEVAVRHSTTRFAAPVGIPPNLMMVGLEQSDAILVRAGVVSENAHGQTYAAFPPPEFTPGFTLRRGWTQVDANIGGEWVRFVNTHLEIQPFAPVQQAQAAELIAHLADSPHPVILVGDFNSAANRNAPGESKTGSYQLFLDAGFHDLWLPHDGVSNNSGPTCCQASDLSNRASELDQRLDLVLARDVDYWQGSRSAAVKVELFGNRPPDRFVTAEGYHLWPSDHAGVFARILMSR